MTLSRCEALLFIADGHGDNEAEFRCQLFSKHEEKHHYEFKRGGGSVVIDWDKDERRNCDHCGYWEHEHFGDSAEAQEIYNACPSFKHDHDWCTCEVCQDEYQSAMARLNEGVA